MLSPFLSSHMGFESGPCPMPRVDGHQTKKWTSQLAAKINANHTYSPAFTFKVLPGWRVRGKLSPRSFLIQKALRNPESVWISLDSAWTYLLYAWCTTQAIPLTSFRVLCYYLVRIWHVQMLDTTTAYPMNLSSTSVCVCVCVCVYGMARFCDTEVRYFISY